MLTMRKRQVLVWLTILVLVVPGAVFLLDEEFGFAFLNNIELLVAALLILSLSIASWRLKRRLKERMERGLGREVDDIELTSITAWMRIPDQAAWAGREAEKFDFDE